MKTLFAIFFASMVLVGVSAQSKVIKQNRQVAPFTSINASGGWDVVIRQGNSQSVSIEVSEDLLDRVVIEVRNGTLHISNKKNRSFSFRNMRDSYQVAYVTVTDLKKIEASGGGDIRFETPLRTGDFELSLSGGTDLEDLKLNCSRFDGDFSGGCDAQIHFLSVSEVKLDASGGSDVDLRDISAQTTKISASGGSNLKITGKTDKLFLDASGGSDVSASGLVANDCDADFSGAADGSIRVTGRLDISVSGSADVTCYGNPAEVDKKVGKSGSLDFK